ncbi:hypothetical protein [Hydrogenophaga sp. A37]|uniref:hypothetical protein n=1 Tax=Hydrogenophaga sp. A37 TaxID=1945864 RepID=UPI0015C55A17|nr:hypothetical protein [Hydrogenophaga sp. A37]
MSEQRERSERREFGDGATAASIAGESAHRAGRFTQALRPERTRLGREAPRTKSAAYP